MPYVPDPDARAVRMAALFLFATVRRPLETDTGYEWLRIDRKMLWAMVQALPSVVQVISRRADFYECVRLVSDLAPDAVIEHSAAARRVDLILCRAPEAWAHLYPETLMERVHARLDELGIDRTTPILDADRIVTRHEAAPEAVPTKKRCARCGVTKPVTEFNRRGADGSPLYHRFQSYDRECAAAKAREFYAANPGYEASRDRSHRYSASRRSAGGIGFGGPIN